MSHFEKPDNSRALPHRHNRHIDADSWSPMCPHVPMILCGEYYAVIIKNLPVFWKVLLMALNFLLHPYMPLAALVIFLHFFKHLISFLPELCCRIMFFTCWLFNDSGIGFLHYAGGDICLPSIAYIHFKNKTG